MTTFLNEKNVELFFNSDPVAGAKNVSANGDYFEVQMSPTLNIPQDAIDLKLETINSTIWWSIPNIIAGVNDRFVITGPLEAGGVTTFNFPIQQGLYDLNTLKSAVLAELENLGAKITPTPIIDFIADNATQKVIIKHEYTGIITDFNFATSFRDILGFNPGVLGPNATAPFNYLADNEAAFNQVNSFLIHCDLVDRGIALNGVYSQIIANPLIDVSPGSQITYAPFNPSKVSCENIKGQVISKITAYLTDENNQSVNTAGESWSFTARISWKEAITV
jgi:hypothetical protein